MIELNANVESQQRRYAAMLRDLTILIDADLALHKQGKLMRGGAVASQCGQVAKAAGAIEYVNDWMVRHGD